MGDWCGLYWIGNLTRRPPWNTKDQRGGTQRFELVGKKKGYPQGPGTVVKEWGKIRKRASVEGRGGTRPV